ncbi:hypothetical protein [Pseudomonas sp. NFPP24]|jgi:hypothetical protein|uniref:hypothetical protein n=1 Tax=Pseudomonas sp. NFPP24 TaxID=1566228 RepID=UPI0008F1FB12|nr:hypothetical protein [Pseudomonas sp. NFPP24]SFB32576.1 hypothetical protein SAMN03159485_04482 [Pseudomonas sp. NFPP24]
MQRTNTAQPIHFSVSPEKQKIYLIKWSCLFMTTIRNDHSASSFTPPPPATISTAPVHLGHVTSHDQDTFHLRLLKQVLEHPLFSTLDKSGKPEGAHFLDLNKFYKQLGGNWNDKSLSPLQRLSLAFKALVVLESIDSMGGAHSKQNDNKIDGVMRNRQTLESRYISNTVHANSEFMRLLDYCERGEEALSGDIVNRR